jgi:hypothetical protein
MRKSAVFWAVVLILVGALLLLNNLGLLRLNVWGLVWSVALIGVGAWILWGVLGPRRAPERPEVMIPLDGAAQARLRIRHGGGRLSVGASTPPEALVAGTFCGGLDYRAAREADALVVDMRVPDQNVHWAMPWHWGASGALDWDFGLNREVGLTLELETGAGEARLDLTDLRVSRLTLKTGASHTTLTAPAHAGHTRIEIEGGATAVEVRVPEGVAARVHAQAGLAGITVDRERFPRVGDVYQSPDYDSAANRVEIVAQLGLGALDVR